MSRPRSPYSGDLDAVLRDDLALEQIGRGRRPRGSDDAVKLLCAIAEDVEVKAPRRRTRGSRLTRGLLATTVAATVLGATGVAAADPGGTNGFAHSQPGRHVTAADRSLAEAQKSLENGNKQKANEQLDRANEELRKAGASTRRAALEERASDLRDQSGEPKTPRPLPTTATAGQDWSWLWGIPGGGPGWQPEKSPYKRKCLLVICEPRRESSSVPQQTPSTSEEQQERPGILFRRPSSATPKTPGPSRPSPSSPSSPTSEPTVPPVSPSLPDEEESNSPSDSPSSPSSSSDDGSSDPGETKQPRPTGSPGN